MSELDIQIQLNKDLKGSTKRTHLSKEEKAFIRDNHKTMSSHAIAKKLCRCATSIRRYGYKNGITFSRKPIIDDETIRLFLEEHPNMPTSRVAEALGTSALRVRNARKEMGLYTNTNATRVYQWLVENSTTPDCKALAEAFKKEFL